MTDATSHRPGLRWHVLAVVVLIVLSAVPRLYHLGQPSLWVDELATVGASLHWNPTWSRPIAFVAEHVALQIKGVERQSSPPWKPEQWRARGIDETVARWPACLIGIFTVPILYGLGCRVIGPRASFCAAAFLALNAWHVYWSQTARFYALQFLFYNAALLMYLRLLTSLTQPTAVVLFGVLVLDGLVRVVRSGDRRALKRLLVGLLVPALVIGVALAVAVSRRPEDWTQFFQKPNLGKFRLVFSGAYFIGPPIVLAALLAGVRALRQRDDTATSLLIAAPLPIFAFSVLGFWGRVELRYCLVCLYAWVGLAGWLAFEIHGRSARAGAWALAGCLAAGSLVPLYDYFRSNGLRPYTREAVTYVQVHRRIGERIFMDPLEGGFYFGEPVAGDPPAVADDTHDEAAWLIYRTDDRGTLPPPRRWTDEHTQLRAVFGSEGIGRMARVYVRYRPAR